MRKRHDIVGKTFGRLTVLSYRKRGNNIYPAWLCHASVVKKDMLTGQ
jgi:hypothetical protein